VCFRPPKAQNHSYAVFLRTKPYNLPPPYFRLSHPKEGTLDMSNTSVSANAMICSKEYSVFPENWGFLFSSGVLNGASTQLHRFPIISFPFLNIFFFLPSWCQGLTYPIPFLWSTSLLLSSSLSLPVLVQHFSSHVGLLSAPQPPPKSQINQTARVTRGKVKNK